MYSMRSVGQAVLSCLWYLVPAAFASEPLRSGELNLDLEGGAGAAGPVRLTLGFRDGRWTGDAWGRATGHNFGQHSGHAVAKQAAGGEESLNVSLAIVPDPVAHGGKAEYVLALRRNGNEFDGRFTGSFCDDPVSGVVRGVLSEPLVRPLAGFKPLDGAEHPRMIFRKADLPELKRRAGTPEGKAMMAMLTARAPLRMPSQVTDRHSSWMAANWGAVYQLTGDLEAAAEARRILMEEVVAKTLPIDRDDLQQAPRLLGVALAYDLCYEAWEDGFRRQMAEFIFMAASDLYRGYVESRPVVAGRFDPVPWRHRNAIRASCAGAAAIAVMGDQDSDGKRISGAANLAMAAERDVAEWISDGVTGAGTCLEGSLKKSLALANGVLAFMQADRTAMGRDMSQISPMLLVGHALTSVSASDGKPKLGISSISAQASGRWPMGFAAVPGPMRGLMRWLFDRDVGLAGRQHFDCAYPYQAAYALANYPFDAEPVDPGTAMPLFVADVKHGQVVFRNRWKDADDIVATLDFNASSLPGLEPRTAPQAGGVRIVGLGREWVDGVLGVKPVNPVFGGELIYATCERPGQAIVGATMDRAYRTVVAQAARQVAKPKEWGTAPVMRFDAPAMPESTDAGMRVTRHAAIDYTGASGVPALFVFVDVLKGIGSMPWSFPGPGAGSGGEGAGMSWWKAVQPLPQGSRGGTTQDGVRVAVGTMQSGKPPDAKVSVSADGKASVSVGGQSIHFTGDRIVFAR
jgi:hypothetical protein